MKEKKTTTPNGTASDNLDCRIDIRCTAEDKRRLLSLAGGRGELSSFLLAAGFRSNSNPKAKGQRKELIEALAQLGKIGSNVNQLARAANSGDTPSGRAIELAMQEVLRCAAAIRAELQRNNQSSTQ